MRWWQRRGLGFKIALGISLTLFLILGGVFLGVSAYVRAQLWQRQVQTAENLNAMTAILLEDAMMAGHQDRVQEAIMRLGQSGVGQIDDIAVYDDQAVLTSFASGFPGGRTIQRESLEEDVTGPTCWGCHQFPPGERPVTMVVSLEGQEVLRSVLPLYNEPRCQTCHGTGKEVLGDSIVDFRLGRYQQASTTVTLGLGGGMVLSTAMVALALYLLLRRIVLSPLGGLVAATQAVIQGELDRQVQVRSGDEVGQVGAAFNSMTTQLRELVGSLEQRVTERTIDLQRRSTELEQLTHNLEDAADQSRRRALRLETSAQVARTLVSVLDPEALLDQVVDLIADRVGFYHVGIFLLEETGQHAILRAANSVGGQQMLARGHRLRVGEEGIVGYVTAAGRPRISLDVGAEAVHFDNPDLPLTRSEMALPLVARGRILGALDVQSIESEAFDYEDVAVLQTLADQVAVALDNARLFEESQNALRELQRVQAQYTAQSWRSHRAGQPVHAVEYTRPGVAPQAGELPLEADRVVATGETFVTVGDGDGRTGAFLVVPLKLHGQTIGLLGFQETEQGRVWTEDEITLAETVAEQITQTLESARLFQETQLRAWQEQAASRITAQIRSSPSVEDILQITAEELGRTLGVSRTIVRLGVRETSSSDRR